MIYDDIFLFKAFTCSHSKEKSKQFYEKLKYNKDLNKRLNLHELISQYGNKTNKIILFIKQLTNIH